MNIFESKEQYLSFRQDWADIAKDEEFYLTLADFIMYAIARNKDPRKCIAANTREQTIINTKLQLKWGKFKYIFKTISEDNIDLIRNKALELF